jgi:adenylate cyclase
MEIERKFAIKKLPDDLSIYECKNIEQGYLCHNPILRIRRSNDKYILTYKSKLGMELSSKEGANINNEIELPLTKEAYQSLKKKTEGNMIYKKRYLIPILDGLTAELDIFEEQLSGLIFAEVEFPDVNTADSFIAPDWFGKDLTRDKRYSNYHLSKLSSPQELC